MAEERVTSIIVLPELDGDGERVTSFIVLPELDGVGERVTSMLVLTEFAALAAYFTSMIVLVEFDTTPGKKYSVALGHNVPIGFLVPLSPQPSSPGIKVIRRDYAQDDGDPVAEDIKEYVEFEYSGLQNAQQYRDVLASYDLLANKTSKITIWCRDNNYEWTRRNGIAIRPLLNRDARWDRFFPRSITIRVIELEEPSE